MLDMVVHVVAIGAVIGYVEYRLRSYAALMVRFDAMENRQTEALSSTSQRLLQDHQATAQSVDSKLTNTITALEAKLAEHEQAVLATEKSGIAQIRDAVAGSLKSFSDSVWRGVHSMAESIALPTYPTFTCYYCKQQFAITQRERIGENDYCPEHGSKRKAVFQANTKPTEAIAHDRTTGVHPTNRGDKQSDHDKLPWLG